MAGREISCLHYNSMKFSFKWKDLNFYKRREDPIELNNQLKQKLIEKFYWGSKKKKIILPKSKDPLIRKKEKVTVGITALSFLRELIEKMVCDLDVGFKFLPWRRS